MRTPWLTIPLDDYEGHMSLPAVGQACMLAEQLDQAVGRCAARRIAVIGCAGGNGLERLEGRSIDRLVAIDVNPSYIEQTHARFSERLPSLEALCADVQATDLTYGPVDFTYAALLLEYVDITATLRTLRRNSGPGACLTTVLQLPHATAHQVSTSPYASLKSLTLHMRLVAPEELDRVARSVGFSAAEAMELELASGKRFCVQNFTL